MKQIDTIVEKALSELRISLLLVLMVTGIAMHSHSQPYVGEIRIFNGNFPPQGWYFCDGSLLPISENEILFQLIGTTYGGDGQETFALPDLRGRTPIHMGNGYIIGENGGLEQVTLLANQMPSHSHGFNYNDGKGEAVSPASAYPARNSIGADQYTDVVSGVAGGSMVQPGGGSQPHENRQPYLAVNYIISMYGIFPSQTSPANSSGEYQYLGHDGKISQFNDALQSEPLMAEIRIFAFNFTPKGWAVCNGQFLPINQNQALFSLLGTTYGGNGQTTFALPDLRGRAPIHHGQGNGLRTWSLGEKIGESAHTLSLNEMPGHTHLVNASSDRGIFNDPAGNLLASNFYGVPAFSASASDFHSTVLAPSGGNQPHENMKPFLTLNFCIAMIGIFPSQNSPVSSGIIMGAEAFVAQTTIVAFNFAPKGYAMCNGQLLPISQNTALFSLLGTIYGGNGQSNFALPDFRGRLGIQQGQGPGLSPYDLGQTGGVEQVTLTVPEIPQHSHQFMVGSNAVSDSPDGNYFASFPMAYTSASPNVTLNAGAITSAGGGLPHNNIMPSIGLNFIIATEGEFPQRP